MAGKDIADVRAATNRRVWVFIFGWVADLVTIIIIPYSSEVGCGY
ncbi:hypothetical protein GCM10022278_29740 [Allohahella marinimesophila]|uniref:Uncharacterized protein n=1 Tax=Allohahella marinimesophila TaxID=1054972 RepID=A0ABP7PS29_9GAMM